MNEKELEKIATEYAFEHHSLYESEGVTYTDIDAIYDAVIFGYNLKNKENENTTNSNND